MYGLPDWYLYIKIPLMFIQALAGMLVFTKLQDAKEYLKICLPLCTFVGFFILLFLYTIIDLRKWFLVVMIMVFVYLFVVAIAFLCFRYSLSTSLLIGANGYLVQHIAGCLKGILKSIILTDHSILSTFEVLLLDFVCCGSICAIIYFLFRPKVDEVEELDIRWKIAFIILIFLLSIGVSRLTKGVHYEIQPSIVENLYNIVCGFLLIFLQFDIAHRFKLVGDVATMQQIVRQQYLQYEKSKENVQLVNEKYHDLKKMINSMKGYVNTKELEELEKKVAEYAPHISTGKEVIDVILNEKRMICEKQNIRITSLVGGGDLDFVQELDLYALFSNALENAMDAVGKLPQAEERYINLSVSRTNDMVVIHIENPYDGNLISENGLPKSNRDPRYHGFGMASMERIAEQYGGSISVSTIGNRFCLDIILFDI